MCTSLCQHRHENCLFCKKEQKKAYHLMCIFLCQHRRYALFFFCKKEQKISTSFNVHIFVLASTLCTILLKKEQKKSTSFDVLSFCVSIDLFYRTVASRVSSAQYSLTTVFGMGTGGPCTIKTLTCWCTFRDSNPGPTD